MSDEISGPIEVPPLPEVELGDGRTAISYEGTFYRVRMANGEVQAFPAKGKATPENAIDDLLTNPAPVPLGDYIATVSSAVQAMLDARAQQRGYDGILSAASYADDPTGIFAAEGAAFKRWRSEVWGACYAALAEHSGDGALPTVEEFIANLPALAL